MSKPIEQARKMKDLCRFCAVSDALLIPINYSCGKRCMGVFDEACTLTDWAACPFNPETHPVPPRHVDPFLDDKTYDIYKLQFDSAGKFYYACQHHLHLKNKREVDLILKKNADAIIVDEIFNPDFAHHRQAAWHYLVEHYGAETVKGG